MLIGMLGVDSFEGFNIFLGFKNSTSNCHFLIYFFLSMYLLPTAERALNITL